MSLQALRGLCCEKGLYLMHQPEFFTQKFDRSCKETFQNQDPAAHACYEMCENFGYCAVAL